MDYRTVFMHVLLVIQLSYSNIVMGTRIALDIVDQTCSMKSSLENILPAQFGQIREVARSHHKLHEFIFSFTVVIRSWE